MVGDGYARHTPNLFGSNIIRVVSIDAALISHVSELLTQLANDSQWYEVGDTIADVVSACDDAVYKWYSDMLIGSVFIFMGTIPSGWLALDGATYSKADYPELFDKLDSIFVNEVAETFTLPDLSGSTIIQDDGVMGIGAAGGQEAVTLSIDEMPAHQHNYIPPLIDIDVKSIGAPIPYGARLGTATPTTSTGGDQAHDNMPPYLALNYGVYSGREEA